MMHLTSCYDAVKTVTDQATERFDITVMEDAALVFDLQNTCNMIDNFSKAFHGVRYDIDVDTESRKVIVYVICDCFQTTPASSNFCDLMDTVDAVGFEPVADNLFKEVDPDDNPIRIKFTLAGIWVPTP